MTNAADFVKSRNLCLALARVHKALVLGGGDPVSADAFAQAQGRWNSTPEALLAVQKAAIAPLSTHDDLVAIWLPLGRKVFESLQPLTIFGRLRPFMHRLPFRTRVILASETTEAQFFRENGPSPREDNIPVTDMQFLDTPYQLRVENLIPRQLGLISVWTKELMRLADPAAEETISGELVRSLAAGLDRQFIDPGRGYVSSLDAPGAVTASTSGAVQLTSSGGNLAQVDADLQAMINALVANKHSLSTAHWIMSPKTATYLAALRDSGAGPAFPNIGALGGELLGLPVLTSTACGFSGSPATGFIALVEAGQVAYATDETAQVEYSTNADLILNNSPNLGAGARVSLWQNDLAATKTILSVNWKIREGAAAVLTGVTY